MRLEKGANEIIPSVEPSETFSRPIFPQFSVQLISGKTIKPKNRKMCSTSPEWLFHGQVSASSFFLYVGQHYLSMSIVTVVFYINFNEFILGNRIEIYVENCACEIKERKSCA